MVHDGRSIHIRVENGRRPIEFTIPAELGDGAPFSFHITPGAFHRLNWLAARRVNEIFTGSSDTHAKDAAFRPSRTATRHLRMIQTLDGRIAGASHRDIAEVLFGDPAVRRGWSADGDLRAQVRYLARRSAELSSGGYRQLAGLIEDPGDSPAAPDSP